MDGFGYVKQQVLVHCAQDSSHYQNYLMGHSDLWANRGFED